MVAIIFEQSSILLERIHQVLEKLVWTYNINKTYIDTNDRRLVILMATALKIRSTEKVLKYYNLGGLVFDSDITLPIKYTVY